MKKFGLTEQDFIVDEKLVFYLTSFSGKYESTYEICKEVCKKMSLTLLRGDEIETTGDIFSQIIRYIVRASLIIVNIDGKNPNVFYELGIAHALGKNIMFISNRNNEPPFDVRQYRTIFYNTNEELKQSLPESINKYIYHNQNPAKDNKYLEESLEIRKRIVEEACKNISNKTNVHNGLQISDPHGTKYDYNKASELYSHIIKNANQNVQTPLKVEELHEKTE